MRLTGTFAAFTNRVLECAEKGGLASKDRKRLSDLLDRTGKRNVILAKGILTALKVGGASQTDIKRFGELLLLAQGRISQDKDPFTKSESEEVSALFRKSSVSVKTSRWFSRQMDELLAEEIGDFITGSRKLALVPNPKSGPAGIQEDAKEERKGKKAAL